MKRSLTKAALIAVTAMLAVAPAEAQQISTSLPMTSVGSHLLWEVGDQTLTLTVPVGGQVKLDLYSPRLDQSDYRSPTYYGDEQYDGNVSDVTTTFVLTDPQGRQVLKRAFTPGSHDWETLLDEQLPAGAYKLKAVTQGNGKNTFALRLTGSSAAITADHLTVNVHSQEWMPVVNVSTDGAGYNLRMYDGDGGSELKARLRYPDGSTQPLAVSREREWVSLAMPAQPGDYVVELRQVPGAVQYSNTVGFSLHRANVQVPLTLTQVDETGLLEVTAELLLPTGNRATTIGASVNGQTVTVDGELSQKVLAGDYAVKPDGVAGARVSISESNVQVPKNGVGRTHIQVQPEVALQLEADKPQVCVGDVVQLRASALTDYRSALPLEFDVSAEGVSLAGERTFAGELSALDPAELTLEAVAQEAGTYTVTARSDMWGQEVTRSVEVLPQSTTLQLRREVPGELEPGQTATVRVLLTNTGTVPTGFSLHETAAQGLRIVGQSQFTGEVPAGQTKELTYQVQATEAGQGRIDGQLNSGTCAITQTSGTQVAVNVPPAPTLERSSEVFLPFIAPPQAKTLVIAHSVPDGADYVVGSAKLDGEALGDPEVGPSGQLYWEIPAEVSGQVTYSLSHEGPLPALAPAGLLAQYAAERHEVLKGSFDVDDYTKAKAFDAAEEVVENAGAVKLPVNGEIYRSRDKITVTIEKPMGDTTPLLINGEPVSEDKIGTDTQDGPRQIQRLTYVGVPLQVGPNVLRQGNDEITVMLAGRTSKVLVEPEQLVADGSSPIRVKLTAVDEFGTPTAQPTLTLNTNLEPYIKDASSSEAGYQLRLINGEGMLQLRPQTIPEQLEVAFELDGEVEKYRLQLVPDDRHFGVGIASATLGFNFDNFDIADDLLWTARGYYEGPIGGGKLFIAGDKDGLPNDYDPFERYPMAGDSSVHSAPLQGIDPIAAVYDHPHFQAAYQRTQPPISVLPLGETFTTLTASSKTNPKVSGFAAYLPNDRIELKGDQAIVPDGLRIIYLTNENGNRVTDISRGSDSLEMVVRERVTGTELSREKLMRFDDYSIDYSAGVITLNKAITPVDANFNDVVIEASYRLDNELQNREWAYGAQAAMEGDDWVAGVAAVSMPGRAGNQVTVGARAQYDNNDNVRADARAAYSGGVQASLDAEARFRQKDRGTLNVRYQDEDYKGLGEYKTGFGVKANYTAELTRLLSGSLRAEYFDNFNGAENGFVQGTADYRLAPFTAGGGLRYSFGDKTGLSAVVRGGYIADPINAGIEHVQPFYDAGDTVTTFSAGYRLSKQTTLKLADKFTWGESGGHRASVGLDSRVGNTNYSVGYELPNASGDGNRARFGVSTSFALGERTTLGLRGDSIYNVGDGYFNASAGADVKYKAERYVATAGADVKYSSKTEQFTTAVRGGVSGSISDELVLTADALAQFAESDNGQRFSVGYAYRSGALNSLGYARYTNGSLAGSADKAALNTGIAAEFRQYNWAVRGGHDSRYYLNDEGSYAGQAYLGGTYYLNDRFGLGGWGRMFYAPATDSYFSGYGLEGSVRALPGTWLTAGYNFAGFEGLDTQYTYTKPGAYLRLDLALDENTYGGQK